jgi:hypothetical protein
LQNDFLNAGKNAIAETQQLLDESADTFKTTLTSPSINNPEAHEPK